MRFIIVNYFLTRIPYFCPSPIPAMMERIYFDHAATTPLAPEVLEAMLPYMRESQGNPSSIHADGRKTRAAIEKARRHIARNIGASIGEIFFTSGGTESNNMALYCSVRDLGVRHIISSPTEHHCILHTLDALVKHQGVEVSYLDVDSHGHIKPNELQELLANSSKKTLVSLMYANNEIGTLHDIQHIAAICKEQGALFHTDAVQAMGLLPIDVSQTPISFLSGAAHKFFGPKGTGFIYINNENMVQPYLHGGAQERNMRGGTENLYGIVGMAEALDLACLQMEERHKRLDSLRQYMLDELQKNIPGLVANGCPEHYLPKVLSVSIPPSPNSDMLIMLLDMAGISASGGSACSSGVEQASHVLAAVANKEDYLTIRFSFSHRNTHAEADHTVATLKGILQA